jgi:polyhydroxybutyrate depolymerase
MGLAARLAVFLFAMALSASPSAACGPNTDCLIDGRTYRIALPPGDGPFGAIVYMHGWRSSAAAVMGDEALRKTARELGVALVAPKSGGEGWLIAHRPRSGFDHDRRETDYFRALLKDVMKRFSVDPDRVLATGFSSGGMMTWTLACRMPEHFSAFLPVAGTFWAPVPQNCARDTIDLVHVHGTADSVVPLEGRAIADSRQGDVPTALSVLGQAAAYRPVEASGPPGLACEGKAAQGRRLLLCLHDGGHVIQPAWIAWAWHNLVND